MQFDVIAYAPTIPNYIEFGECYDVQFMAFIVLIV